MDARNAQGSVHDDSSRVGALLASAIRLHYSGCRGRTKSRGVLRPAEIRDTIPIPECLSISGDQYQANRGGDDEEDCGSSCYRFWLAAIALAACSPKSPSRSSGSGEKPGPLSSTAAPPRRPRSSRPRPTRLRPASPSSAGTPKEGTRPRRTCSGPAARSGCSSWQIAQPARQAAKAPGQTRRSSTGGMGAMRTSPPSISKRGKPVSNGGSRRSGRST